MLKLHDVIVLEGSTFSKQDGQQSTSMKFPFSCQGGLGIDRRSMHRFCHDYVMSRKWSQMQWHGGGSWIWAALPFVWCSHAQPADIDWFLNAFLMDVFWPLLSFLETLTSCRQVDTCTAAGPRCKDWDVAKPVMKSQIRKSKNRCRRNPRSFSRF